MLGSLEDFSLMEIVGDNPGIDQIVTDDDEAVA